MAKKASKKKVARKKAGDRAGRARSQSATEQPAKVTLGGGRYNLVFRMPPELSAPPSDIARVLRRTAARIRKLTEYIRAVHVETEGGYYSHTLSPHPAAKRLMNDIEDGFRERNWDCELEARQASEPGWGDQGQPWESAELNSEPVYYTGEYDLRHPANAPLREAAFPAGSGLDAPGVDRPNRVHVYIQPDYPELGNWRFRWIMLSIPLHEWFAPTTGELSVLADTDIVKLEEYAAWSERFAGYIELIGGERNPAPGPVLTEAALKRLREPVPTEPLPDDVHYRVLRYLRDQRGHPTKEQVRDAIDGYGRHLIRSAISDLHAWKWVYVPPRSRKGVALLDAGRDALKAEETRTKQTRRD